MVDGSAQAGIGRLTSPSDVPIGSNQHGGRSLDFSDDRYMPRPVMPSSDDTQRVATDPLNAALTRSAEIEEERSSVVEQVEDPGRAVVGVEVEVGHPSPDERVDVV